MAAVRHCGFSYFRNFCEKKIKFAPISSSSCKIWRRSDDARPSYCVFSIFKMAAVRHCGFSYFRNFCAKKIKFAPISSSSCKNLVKIGRSAAELLRIIDFQNGGRPPSWIWYDVIAENPRIVLVFDGLNILLKLHDHPVNILRDITIFTRETRSIARYLLR